LKDYSNYWGIILAAGASERMGSPKWKVEINGKSFLQNIISAFNSAGIIHILTVFRNPLPSVVGCTALLNPHPERGQLSSLKIALRELPNETPFIMQLVDRPLVKASTFSRMMNCCDGESIIIPVFNGRKGHPALFPPEMKSVLLSTDELLGIRGGIAAGKTSVKLLEVEDEAILWNIDTQEDLTAAKKRFKPD